MEPRLYNEAIIAIREDGKASTSYFQRKLRITHAQATELIAFLEQRGVIGSENGSKPREIIWNRIT